MAKKEFLISRWGSFWEYLKKHERHAGVVAILTGFVWDSLTLVRPDRFFENVTVLSYLLISAGGIILLTTFEKKGKIAPTILLMAVPFAFGNLAGGLTVLYGHSGTLEGSFLFFLLLGVFIVGNELLRDRYPRLNFHISVWYFLLLSYIVLVIPIITGSFGDNIFILSSLISLAIVSGFLIILFFLSPRKVIDAIRKTVFSIVAIFASFNVLYFLNIIPPVPLSLREIGIYHTIERADNGNYKVLYEKPDWYLFLRDTSAIFTRVSDEKAYCFSSVFAPVGLTTAIYHRWEYYGADKKKWQTATLVSFPIIGGRESGYRGYSEKLDISAGRWRCSVETERGALIGRTTFGVVESKTTPTLYEKEF
ncbi:MAG: DUF2914 domain-containing protein [Patescibacteria group bacterium]